MSLSIRHKLPLLVAGQAQKEVTHNEALAAIDRALQLAVVSRSVTAPPAAVAGDSYLVPAGASGAWAGEEGRIALFDGVGWVFSDPVTGTAVWVADEQGSIVWNGGWSSGWPVSALMVGERLLFGVATAEIAEPVGGSIVDVEARACLGALLSALRSQGVID
ncbi:DUF2793 domain-containing protein [Polymorphobacter sp.]|uniref:DUF2793 domain-containing protein n=1 Tax=Polymorphobacter sp. TaxID=1909290 RepID=UPI003F710DA8